jgi:hypothetical protein
MSNIYQLQIREPSLTLQIGLALDTGNDRTAFLLEDAWIALRNRTAPRADRKKLLPHGIPELIRQKPENYSVLDFKVCRSIFVKQPSNFCIF